MLFSKSSPSTIATVRPQQVQLSPDRPDEFRAQSNNKKSNRKKRKPRPKVNKKVPKFEKEPLEVTTSGGYSLRRRDCSQAEDQGPDSPSIPPRAKRLNSAGKMVPGKNYASSLDLIKKWCSQFEINVSSMASYNSNKFTYTYIRIYRYEDLYLYFCFLPTQDSN